MATLSHVFTMCCGDWEWLPAGSNPFLGLSKLRESKGRTRNLSDDERDSLLAETAKDATLHTLVTLALATAARAGELVRLTWADVDLKDGRLLFRITKNAQPRTAWVRGDALDQLKQYAKARQLHRPEVFPGKGRPHTLPGSERQSSSSRQSASGSPELLAAMFTLQRRMWRMRCRSWQTSWTESVTGRAVGHEYETEAGENSVLGGGRDN